MTRPKTTPDPNEVPITESVSRLWCIDPKNDKIVHFYDIEDFAKFTKFNNVTYVAFNKHTGKQIQLYFKHRFAKIAQLKQQIQKNKAEWQTTVDKSYQLNLEIGKQYEELRILEDYHDMYPWM